MHLACVVIGFIAKVTHRRDDGWTPICPLDASPQVGYSYIGDSRYVGVETRSMTVGMVPEVQEFLRALASETRQRILFLFGDGQERTVSQVAEESRLGQSTASEHLTTLRRAGLLQARREGKEVYYYPDRARIPALVRRLTDMLSRCCRIK